MTILVTGGAGFIGTNFVLEWCRGSAEPVVNLDKLTYAANRDVVDAFGNNDRRHLFIHGDISDCPLVDRLLAEHRPRAVLHFAAESHVDRSIHGPETFIETNIVGTFRLLESVRGFWQSLDADAASRFRFLHVSTDEVYGSLEEHDPAFSETTPYQPNSPYSASKASSDHLVRAYHHTYGLPAVITNCSNNYGPFQHLEKLIPLCIHNALAGLPIPVYGDGLNIRDWLYVTDHCRALRVVLENAADGESFNIGGRSEMRNIEVVRTICGILDEVRPRRGGGSYAEQITFVRDRAGHDRRYAIDAAKIERVLGWRPAENFQSGIRKTILWYTERHPAS